MNLTAMVAAVALAASPAADQAYQIAGPAGPLGGVLKTASTSSPRAVAVIIPGSGPVDHDGNSPGGLRAATYALLAQELSADGVTTVRVDKRGMYGSAAPGVDPNRVTLDDYAKDTTRWAEALTQRASAPCAWLIGHSEGAVVAILTAVKKGKVCGLILLAPPGRSLADVIASQLHDNPANAPLLPAADAALAALKQGRHVDSAALPPPLRPLFRAEVQDFLIAAFRIDPAVELSHLDLPVLILGGDEDLQIGPMDISRLAKAKPGAKVIILNGVNHVLKDVPADRSANLASYADPNLPLDRRIVPAISGFIASHR
jgi:pimeloyl-ACP methyl ester carboxylesterase